MSNHHNVDGTTDDFYDDNRPEEHLPNGLVCFCDKCNAHFARLERKAAAR